MATFWLYVFVIVILVDVIVLIIDYGLSYYKKPTITDYIVNRNELFGVICTAWQILGAVALALHLILSH